MSRSHYFYFHLSLDELETLVDIHQKEFDTLLEESFSDEELLTYEIMIDSIGALYVQPILEELSFDDFYANPHMEDQQHDFFKYCRSSIALENLPYLENNPFQVTYLKILLSRFGEVLIDPGGVSELQFKEDYLKELNRFKGIDELLQYTKPIEVHAWTSMPIEPIDFLVQDVYKELERLSLAGKGKELEEVIKEQNAKIQKLFLVLNKGHFDASLLYQKSGLSPKDFDDYLEKLKFTLRKL